MSNPYEPPHSDVGDIELQPAKAPPPSSGPHGIGGWLILVVIGLVVSPIRAIVHLATLYVPMVRDGTWGALTTAGEATYHPFWAPLLIYEVIGNVVVIALAIIILVLMFKHSRLTPKLATVWYTWGAVFVVSDYFLADLIPAVAENPNPDDLKEMIRSLIAAAIWIPYFRVSKRVKATFVK